MTRVMASGTFDLLHAGHLYYLMQAKSLGDELVVVVARDSTVEKLKGRKPLLGQTHRRALGAGLKPVDKAVLGHDYSAGRAKIVKEVRPDIIALGYDQVRDIGKLKQELKTSGWDGKMVRIKPFHPGKFKSGKIRERMLQARHHSHMASKARPIVVLAGRARSCESDGEKVKV